MAKLSRVRSAAPDLIAAATLTVETPGEGFTEITRDVARFVAEAGAGDGVLLVYMRHEGQKLEHLNQPGQGAIAAARFMVPIMCQRLIAIGRQVDRDMPRCESMLGGQ